MIIKNALWTNIFKSEPSESIQTISVLKQVPIFDKLSEKDLNTVSKILHYREYEEKELVFQSGTPGLGMYIIIEGDVVIKGQNPNGENIELAQLSSGDFFGEISLISEDNRSTNAIAQSSCKLVAFVRSDLLDIINRSPQLGNKILLNLSTVLGNRLTKTNELLINAKTI